MTGISDKKKKGAAESTDAELVPEREKVSFFLVMLISEPSRRLKGLKFKFSTGFKAKLVFFCWLYFSNFFLA